MISYIIFFNHKVYKWYFSIKNSKKIKLNLNKQWYFKKAKKYILSKCDIVLILIYQFVV